jgi:DNA-binding transcriptional ArsR family regulator
MGKAGALVNESVTLSGAKKGNMIIVKPQVNTRKASVLLKAMGNERRLMILHYLTQGEKSVGELEGLIGLSQSALSQHLARLRREHLVRTRRDAQSIYYSLNGNGATVILEALGGLCADTPILPAGLVHESAKGVRSLEPAT